ncbi:OLC1v1011485C1 [Oldenlandia corymbosa var. corymbosa]|uniref:OLC1v1011485C1 n=1 Tax=Oldenlandia corymbosa var. corymbosa TaxID=529605 RepID=A0AAV1DTU2_OLDCO|nr:OLC1v1011485C1 [Oldenlandia corymbosa var. corymbosa]
MGRRKNNAVSDKGHVIGSKKGREEAPRSDTLTAGKDVADNLFEGSRDRTDLLFEVLARLPPPVLFKFRSVSKGFRSLIGQSDFAAHQYRTCKAIAGKALTGFILSAKNGPGFRLSEWLKNEIRFLPLYSEVGLPDPFSGTLEAERETRRG